MKVDTIWSMAILEYLFVQQPLILHYIKHNSSFKKYLLTSLPSEISPAAGIRVCEILSRFITLVLQWSRYNCSTSTSISSLAVSMCLLFLHTVFRLVVEHHFFHDVWILSMYSKLLCKMFIFDKKSRHGIKFKVKLRMKSINKILANVFDI